MYTNHYHHTSTYMYTNKCPILQTLFLFYRMYFQKGNSSSMTRVPPGTNWGQQREGCGPVMHTLAWSGVPGEAPLLVLSCPLFSSPPVLSPSLLSGLQASVHGDRWQGPLHGLSLLSPGRKGPDSVPSQDQAQHSWYLIGRQLTGCLLRASRLLPCSRGGPLCGSQPPFPVLVIELEPFTTSC